RINDPNLEVNENSILILKNVGPKGAPGMPEVGQIPIPKKLLKQGIRDMVRISDGRISGTSYGTLIVHVAPESAVGGPIALVANGDIVELDVEARCLNLKISQQEMDSRKKTWRKPAPHYDRGYGALFEERVLQADLGCDFDFLVPKELRP